MKLAIFTLAAVSFGSDVEPEKIIDVELSPDSGKIVKSNKVGDGFDMFKEWELSVDLKLRKNRYSTWSNVLAVKANRAGTCVHVHDQCQLGDRLPAVYMPALSQTLTICSAVNGDWNHCHYTGDVGTDWFNLKIQQRQEQLIGMPNPFVTKEHFSSTKYDYQVVFSDAETYDAFYFNADLPNDAHIGFSSTTGHDDKKIEIVLGGWAGLQSVIRSANQLPYDGEVKINHTKSDFNSWKKDVKVAIYDGKVVVSIGDKVLMSWADESIKKSDLTNLLVSGGWGGSGNWVIQGYNEPKPLPSVYMFEIFIDNKLQYSIENESPSVYKDVKAEIANGWRNGASKGNFKNFSLKTTKPPKELPPVESRIENLQANFGEILESSNLRQVQVGKFKKKFTEKTDDLILLYEILRDSEKHKCEFPKTWKKSEDEEDEVDRYVQDDPCKAIKQMVTGAEKWAMIFGKDCKRAVKNPGTEYNMMNRMMKKVEQVGAKVQKKLDCTENLVTIRD